MKHLFTLAFALCLMSTYAQDDIMNELESEQKPQKEYVSYTFKTTRVISAHSVEVVKKGALDFRISHRFGDIASSGNDHIHSMFGFDQAADILFAFEYGVTDDLTLGIGRAKGAGPLRELWNANIKYRVLKQTRDFKNPFTITLFANASISSMRNSGDPTSLSYFPKGGGYANFANRMAYTVQGLFGIKATKWLSVQFTPTFVWHNNVAYNDNNYLFLMGFSARAKFTQRAGFIFEYFLPLTKPGVGGREYFPMVRGMKNAMYYPALNVGFEFETGGHIFHINVTNTRGMLEQDFLAYNTANWAQGEFRLGFTISRTFQLGKKAKGEKYWKKGSVEDAKNNKQ